MKIENNLVYQKQNLIAAGPTLNLDLLQQLQKAPPPFTPGEPLFWDDPHISEQMLKAHLNPHTDAASYRPETIDRLVEWLVETLALRPEKTVLDLGCGPGLYAARLAERGIDVTGVDYSQRSIEYARRYAAEHGLSITYRYQDYLTLEDVDRYDVALLISGDFCPLSPERRARLLRAVRRALKEGGHFALDVSTPAFRKGQRSQTRWAAVDSGFWKPGPYLVLEQGFDYPEQAAHLNQFTVIEAGGALSVYRNWFQDFTPETLADELASEGFVVTGLWSDLTGTPYKEGTEWFGVIARKS